MKDKIKKHYNLIIVSCLAVIFFICTASFNYSLQDKDYVKWSSPDETANYFFSKKFSLDRELSFFDPAAIEGDNMVMPRSLRSDFGWLKPVSFLGIIIIYGSIAGVIGTATIPFLTPFFAAMGIIFFYFLIKRIFSDRVALWSAFLLATFPVYVYYTVRSMFHNVLFIILLILALYFLIISIEKRREKRKFFSFHVKKVNWKNYLFAFLGGGFVGLAIITRTSELLWLVPVLGIMWLFYVKRFGLTKLILSLAGLFLALIPVVYWNQILYSSPIYGGYNEMNRSLDDLSQSSNSMLSSISQGRFDYLNSYVDSIKENVFYFGFKYDQSLEMFDHYVIDMFPILFYLSLFGLLLLIIRNIRKFKRKHLVYVLMWIVLSVILVFYYGSWKFNDNPDPNRFTIGNSYTRYWLPIYLMMMPLASLAIVSLSRALVAPFKHVSKNVRVYARTGLQITAMLVIASSSLLFVLYGSEEGLTYLYYNNKAERVTAEKVFELTEPESIIITRYHDKFFFPERRVIMGILPNEEIFSATEKLVKNYPVYYYNFYLNEKDVEYLNTRKLIDYNLEIQLTQKFNSKFGLYQINEKTQPKN